MLLYIYVDVLTQRIFRKVPYDHRFIPAVLDGVVGMVFPEVQLREDNLCWSKFKTIFTAPTAPDDRTQARLSLLSERCEVLEYLYRTLYLLRRSYFEAIPLDEVIFQKRITEAQKYLSGEALETEGFLSQFAREKEMTLQEAAQLILFAEIDRDALLKVSEGLRLKWEKVFRFSENPMADFQKFKMQTYIG